MESVGSCRERRPSSCRGHREHRGFCVDLSVTFVCSVVNSFPFACFKRDTFLPLFVLKEPLNKLCTAALRPEFSISTLQILAIVPAIACDSRLDMKNSVSQIRSPKLVQRLLKLCRAGATRRSDLITTSKSTRGLHPPYLAFFAPLRQIF
jgi:hypothetical protein